MKMTETKCVVSLLVVLMSLWTLTRGDVADVEVSCVFMESCFLPCSFQPGPDVVIHWIQETPGNAYTHSYYRNQDQVTLQNQRFRGRTSLFRDQISRGNASLQLTGVEVQDEGRYQCYTSTETAEKSFINLKVNAPVSKVDMKREGNRITCSSEGIYPEPELTWTTNPPSNVTFKNSTTVQQTERQLYSINSSLTVSDGVTGLDYSCTVSTDRSNMTVTLLKSKRSSNVGEQTKKETVTGVVVAMVGFVVFVGVVVYCLIRVPSSKAADSGPERNHLRNKSETTRGQLEEESDEERRGSLL